METILEISGLHTHFRINGKDLPAVNGINLKIKKGETLALAGESGCGKTMTALSILRLVPYPGRIVSGKIIFGNTDLLSLTEKEMRRIRGKHISLVFQEPGLALNPVYTIGNQIAEVIKLHRKDINNIKKEVINILSMVKMPDPHLRIKAYPHELSGGMQQRAVIAAAIAGRPELLIADEPTTALDVTIQAQILKLLKRLTRELDMSLLLITHDLGIIAETADTAAIMYAGKIVEYADVYELFKSPAHPYTKGLLNSIPNLDSVQKRLPAIGGSVPDISAVPSGCSFHPRCPDAVPRCSEKPPGEKKITRTHTAACDIIPF